MGNLRRVQPPRQLRRPAEYTALITKVLAETTPQDLPGFGFIRSIDLATATADEADCLTTDLANGFCLRNRGPDMVTVELGADVTIAISPPEQRVWHGAGAHRPRNVHRLWTDEARRGTAPGYPDTAKRRSPAAVQPPHG